MYMDEFDVTPAMRERWAAEERAYRRSRAIFRLIYWGAVLVGAIGLWVVA